MNWGSAVVLPEVFLKALTVARNLGGGRPTHFTAADFDMQRHYRPRVNVVQRPTQAGGAGYLLTGHHEILLPLTGLGSAGQARGQVTWFDRARTILIIPENRQSSLERVRRFPEQRASGSGT